LNANNNYKNTRYARFVPLPMIGKKGMDLIKKSRVTVVGCGGLGSITATQLAALGVGFLRIIDYDKVELTNLQRQLLYRESDIGKLKVEVAKKFLEKINSEVSIEALNLEINEQTVTNASENVDFIIDATDKFVTRYSLNKEALKQNIPFIFGAVGGVSGNAMTIQNDSACLECLFSNIDDSQLPSSSVTGIHPSIINIIGSIQIAEATKIMTKKSPTLLNKLAFCDIGSMQFEVLNVKPRVNCFCSKYKK
jgi:adenylyltransferase/sulfurtransferase